MANTAEILLIEDNPSDQRIALEAFRETAWVREAHVVKSGREAMDFLRHRGAYHSAPRPDLIVMDLNLPDRGGHELLAELKKDEGLKAIPVVVLTGSESGHDVSESYKLGADCYLTKPSRFDAFLSLTRRMEEAWKLATGSSRARLRLQPPSRERRLSYRVTRKELLTLFWLVAILVAIFLIAHLK